MNELVITLMLYIMSVTAWEIPPPPRIIYVKSQKEMFLLSNDCYANPHNSLCENSEEHIHNILALYNHKTKIIILQKHFSIDSIKDQSILLHELVHHFQYYWNPIKYKKMCKGRVEREAYDIQSQWLEKKGHNIFDTIKINDLGLILITTCPYEYVK